MMDPRDLPPGVVPMLGGGHPTTSPDQMQAQLDQQAEMMAAQKRAAAMDLAIRSLEKAGRLVGVTELVHRAAVIHGFLDGNPTATTDNDEEAPIT